MLDNIRKRGKCTVIDDPYPSDKTILKMRSRRRMGIETQKT
jgi:hypothetical protein